VGERSTIGRKEKTIETSFQYHILKLSSVNIINKINFFITNEHYYFYLWEYHTCFSSFAYFILYISVYYIIHKNILYFIFLIFFTSTCALFFFLFKCFFFYFFIFKLYIIVLVLPNIKMNPPQAYMCSPS